MAGTTAEPVPAFLPHGRPFTRADLDAMPHDGNRYELLDGVLIVTPSPAWQHQGVVGGLLVKLRTASPADMVTFVAPWT